MMLVLVCDVVSKARQTFLSEGCDVEPSCPPNGSGHAEVRPVRRDTLSEPDEVAQARVGSETDQEMDVVRTFVFSQALLTALLTS